MEDRSGYDKTLIKATEAANRFNVPLSTIYTWHQMGKIEGVKLNGKSLRIFSQSLSTFIKSRNGRMKGRNPDSGASPGTGEVR